MVHVLENADVPSVLLCRTAHGELGPVQPDRAESPTVRRKQIRLRPLLSAGSLRGPGSYSDVEVTAETRQTSGTHQPSAVHRAAGTTRP